MNPNFPEWLQDSLTIACIGGVVVFFISILLWLSKNRSMR